MSKTRKYNTDTILIMQRFFDALNTCVSNKLIKSNAQYCEIINVPRSHFYTQRKDMTRGFFEIGWVMPLIRQYGVSPSWLLTGTGAMFVKDKARGE